MNAAEPLPLFRDVVREGLEGAFRRFHQENPHVLRALVDAARELRDAGVTKTGIDLLFCRLRWVEAIRTRGDLFRLNDHYRAFYARLLMHRHPELDGFFSLREQRGLSKPFDPASVAP